MNLARVFTVVTAALMTVFASATGALAATPATWEDAEPVSATFLLAIWVGAPLALIVTIVAIAAAINTKAKHFKPTIPASAEVETTSH